MKRLIFSLILLSGFANATLSSDLGLLRYYNSDYPGLLVDQTNNSNMTYYSYGGGSLPTDTTDGIIDNATDYDYVSGKNEYAKASDDLSANLRGTSFWVKQGVTNVFGAVWGIYLGNNDRTTIFTNSANDSYRIHSIIGGSGGYLFYMTPTTPTSYHMVTVCYDDTNGRLLGYINNELKANISHDGNVFNISGNDRYIGTYLYNSNPGGVVDAKIDEISYFTHCPTQTQINQLYNNGSGISYNDWIAEHRVTWNETSTSNTINLLDGSNNTTRLLYFNNATSPAQGNITIETPTANNISLNIFSSGVIRNGTHIPFNATDILQDPEVVGDCNGTAIIGLLDTTWFQVRLNITDFNIRGQTAQACFVAERFALPPYNISLQVNNLVLQTYNLSNFSPTGLETKCETFNTSLLQETNNNITITSTSTVSESDNFEIPLCGRTDGGAESKMYTSTDQGTSWTKNTIRAIPFFFNFTNNVTGTSINYNFDTGENGWINVSATYNAFISTNHTFNISLNPIHAFNVTVISTNATNQTFFAQVLESNNTTHTLTIATPNATTGITGVLIWNGTTQNATTTQNGSTFTLTSIFQVPLATTNRTNVTFHWEYNVSFTSGPDDTKNTSTNNQSILFAYIPTFGAPTNISEGQTFTTTANVTKLTNTANLTSTVEFNSSNFSMSVTENSTLAAYTRALTTLALGASNATFQLNYSLNISIPGESKIRTASQNVTIFQINLTDCSVTSGNEVFTIHVRDEADQSLLNSTVTVTGTINTTNVSKTISTSFVTNTTHHLCALPTTAVTFEIDLDLEYGASGFETRQHFINQLLTTTDTNTLDLFTANLSDTDLWTIIIKDQGNVVESATVKVLRFYPGNSSNILVASGITNTQGRAQFNLFSTTVQYQFIIQVANVTALTTSTAPLTALASENKVVELDINLNPAPITILYKDIQVTCTITTTNTTCTVNDASGIMSRFDMTVDFINALNGTTRLCTVNAFSSTATLQCNNHSLFNGTGTFVYILTGTDGTDTVPLSTGSASRPDDLFGGLGDLMAPFFILFSVLGALSVTKDMPEGLVMGVLLGIGGISIFNLTDNTNSGAIIIISGLILMKIIRGGR